MSKFKFYKQGYYIQEKMELEKLTQLYAQIDGIKYSYPKERYWMYKQLIGKDVHVIIEGTKVKYIGTTDANLISQRLFGSINQIERERMEIKAVNGNDMEKESIMDKYSFGAFSGMIFNAKLAHPDKDIMELIKLAIEVRRTIRDYKVE